MERLSLFRFGTALGMALGGALVLAGVTAWATGLGGEFVRVAASVFRGYGAGPVAAVVGGVWGCAAGFVFGVSLAWIYNRLALWQ
jgi:hypothetical protein